MNLESIYMEKKIQKENKLETLDRAEVKELKNFGELLSNGP